VQSDHAKEFAEKNNLAYIETSAKTADNVEAAFAILIECNLLAINLIIEIYSIKKNINDELIAINPEIPKASKNNELPKA